MVATGVPDEVLGERIALVVTPGLGARRPRCGPLRNGATSDGPTLREWGRQRLDSFKLPDHVPFSDELPLAPTGKLDRIAVQRLALRCGDEQKSGRS